MDPNPTAGGPPPIRPRLRFRFVFGLLVALAASGVAVCAQDPNPTNTAAVPTSRQGAWMADHDLFVRRAAEGKVDLLFLGDSITSFWSGRAPDGPGKVWDRYYAPRNAANFGIGGDRTQHLLWRVQNGELDGIEPKVVVILIGTNNLHGNTPAEVAEGVAAVVEAVRKEKPGAKVLLLGIFPRGYPRDPVRDRIKAVNLRLARLDDGRHVQFLDFGDRFVGPDRTISHEVMPDLLHLTRKGYRIWADAMEPTLWPMFEGEGKAVSAPGG